MPSESTKSVWRNVGKPKLDLANRDIRVGRGYDGVGLYLVIPYAQTQRNTETGEMRTLRRDETVYNTDLVQDGAWGAIAHAMLPIVETAMANIEAYARDRDMRKGKKRGAK